LQSSIPFDSYDLEQQHLDNANNYDNIVPPCNKDVTSTYTKEQRLLAFLLLYYRSHGKDTYINYGEGARILFTWLEVEKIEPTHHIPLGIAIADQYIMQSCLGLHPLSVYSILQKFYLQKTLEGCKIPEQCPPQPIITIRT
jgi:hypothetical protein